MTAATEQRPLGYEANGINVIGEDERKGSPRDLFWPWFAANISVLGLAYGAYVLEGGVSFWQACLAGFIGIVVSFLLVGFIAVAGKRGSAPTLVLSRAAFGVQGNKLPALVSWILNVGWEIVLTVLATLATATVFAPAALERRHRHQGDRLPDHHRAHRRQRGARVRHDHAAADGHHLGDRRADRRVLHPGRREDPLGHGVGHPQRVRAGGARRDRARRHRVRARLGQRGRRLLALPAAPVIRRRGGLVDDVRRVDRAAVPARRSGCCSPGRPSTC